MEFYNVLDLEIAYKEGFAKQFGVVKRLLFLSTSNISFVLKKKKRFAFFLTMVCSLCTQIVIQQELNPSVLQAVGKIKPDNLALFTCIFS